MKFQLNTLIVYWVIGTISNYLKLSLNLQLLLNPDFSDPT